MKKKNITIIIAALIVLAAAYFTMTPKGALRLAVISSGHPISAFTFEIKEEPYTMSIKENQKGYSLENPPVEKVTDSELVNWIVTKHGIFYFAKYYGWA